jgi:hypothetical protein
MATEDFDAKGKDYLLALHILEKGFQTGSLVGGLFVVPVLTYKFGVKNPTIVPRLANGLAISAVCGTVLAGLLCVPRLRSGTWCNMRLAFEKPGKLLGKLMCCSLKFFFCF